MAGPARRLAARLALTTLVSLLLPSVAGWARDGTVSCAPADGAVLATAPTEVELTSATAPEPALSHISVYDAAGRPVDVGPIVDVSRHVLRQPVSITAAGNYTVAYHLVLADGRQAVGAARFSVGTGVPPPAAPVLPGADPADAGHEHGIDPLSGALLGADLIVLVTVAVLLLRRPAPPPDGSPP